MLACLSLSYALSLEPLSLTALSLVTSESISDQLSLKISWYDQSPGHAFPFHQIGKIAHAYWQQDSDAEE